jgi:hypothetical protein
MGGHSLKPAFPLFPGEKSEFRISKLEANSNDRNSKVSNCPLHILGSSFDGFVKSKFPLPPWSGLIDWWEGMKGRGMDKILKSFYSSPPPQPSPIKGEEVFLTFYEFILFDF